jgi:hypothetical protein
MYFQVFKPGKRFSARQIVFFILMPISFLFKTYRFVRRISVFQYHESDEELNDIPNIKAQQQQFGLLSEMDTFVPANGRRDVMYLFFSDYKWPDCNATVFAAAQCEQKKQPPGPNKPHFAN